MPTRAEFLARPPRRCHLCSESRLPMLVRCGNLEKMAEETEAAGANTTPSFIPDAELEDVRVAIKARLFGGPSPAFGRYEIIRQLGAGSMGVVYLARDPDLDRLVAIKRLRRGPIDVTSPEAKQNLASDPGVIRLAREAKAMAKLSHPNVATVYEVAREGDALFVAMEYIDGETLRTWQVRQPRTWLETVSIHVQAGRGLAAAHHARVVHRDYKPDNVLVGSHDGRPRVVDFGLACAGTANPDTASEEVDPIANTPQRCKPRQGRGGLTSAYAA